MNIEQIEAKLATRPNSPLFARLAEEYLLAGRVNEAKTICIAGLETYPNYLTAQIILARCYAAEGQVKSAIQLLRTLADVHPEATAIQALLTQLEAPTPPEPVPPSAPEPEMTPAPIPIAILEEPVEIPETPPEIPPRSEEPKAAPKPPEPVAAPSVEAAPAQPSADEGSIISMTLAEIYTEQNQLVEAIRTYQLLKKRKPELTAKINERIKDLEVRLQVRPMDFKGSGGSKS